MCVHTSRPWHCAAPFLSACDGMRIAGRGLSGVDAARTGPRRAGRPFCRGTAPVTGSGRMASQTRAIASFEAVIVNGPINAVLRPGLPDTLTLRADDNLLSLIETRVVTRGTLPTLEIGTRPNIQPHDPQRDLRRRRLCHATQRRTEWHRRGRGPCGALAQPQRGGAGFRLGALAGRVDRRTVCFDRGQRQPAGRWTRRATLGRVGRQRRSGRCPSRRRCCGGEHRRQRQCQRERPQRAQCVDLRQR